VVGHYVIVLGNGSGLVIETLAPGMNLGARRGSGIVDSKISDARVAIGSSSVSAHAASRQNEKSGLGLKRLVTIVKGIGRSNSTGTASMRTAAEGATDAELVALRSRSVERELQATRTATYVAMYGGF
jgi:hypothetical protein